MTLQFFIYLMLPVVGGLIGWFTNFLAVKMLFHPKEKVKFLFLEIQGIFPKRQKLLAIRLGQVVADELVSMDDIKGKLKNPDNLNGVNLVIESKIDWFLNEGLEESSPFLARFMSDRKREKLKTQVLAEVDELLPLAISTYIDKAEQDMDIKKMVEKKVAAFSSEKLESILHSILDKEFKFIEIVGAVLGFTIGLLQLGIVLLNS